MTRATSLFLDVLRLGAALVVFLAHTAHYWNRAMLGIMQEWAHEAVIVFFVLSGYVIAHSTRDGSRGLRQYALDRLSRLYSVVLPALVLTVVLWVVGRELDPGLYAHYERPHPWVRFLASGVFLNEVWMFELSPPTNAPFWSLGYETWYYVFFGAGLFTKTRWKWLFLGVGLVLAGPNVALLFPVWLVGVAVYTWRDVAKIPASAAGAGLVISVGVTLWALLRLPDMPSSPGGHPWYFAGAAFSDLITAVGWGLMILFFNQAASRVSVPDIPCRALRWFAGHTFSLYLYHAPLIILVTAIAPPSIVRGYGWAPCAAVLILVFVLGVVTEGARAWWRRGFSLIWDFATRRDDQGRGR